MSFKNNIFTAIGISDLNPFDFRLTLIGKSGIYIEGIKGIIDLSPCYIDVDAKNKIISVKGKSLNVTSLNDGDISITGEITQIDLKDKSQ